jgi:hypothetical protein
MFAVLLAGAAAPGAGASSPAVTVTAAPATIELCPGESRLVQVVVRNEGSEAVTKVRFSTFTTDAEPSRAPVELKTDPATVGAERLEPGGTLLVTLTVKARATAPIASTVVQLRAEYALTGRTPGPVRSVSLGTLEVKRPAALAPDTLKTEVKTGFTALREKETGTVVLVLTNGSAGPLTVRSIRATAAPLTQLDAPGDAPTELPAQHALALSYRVTAKGKVVPGKYFGWFDVEVAATTSCGAVMHQLATFEMTLGVSGESELLKLVDVPSLLFLPGFLVIAVGMLLWRVPWLRLRFFFKSETFPIGARDAEFWLLGITLSLALSAIAPGIAIIGSRRAYDLQDIVRLWALSILVGIGFYVVALAADRVSIRVAERLRRKRELGPHDDPLSVIAKMARSGTRVRPAAVQIKDTTMRGFRIWDEPAGGRSWVIPRINCIRTSNKLDGASLLGTNDIRELSRRLSTATGKKQCRLEWAVAGSALTGPRQFPSESLIAIQGMDLIEIVDPEELTGG